MSKVFRLFQDRDLRDWEDRGNAYGPSVIDTINNPDGDYSKKDPTSIPSPFARMDLVRSAFKYVVDKKNLDKSTIYHKLVSDCFDVGEMFFNIDKLRNRTQIKTWDKNIDLNKLLKSQNLKHQLFGETLDLYLKQDAASNNFDSLQKIYFIFYDDKIVGGTSPITLFFSSANDLSFANVNNGNDTFFDQDLKPLYQRDPEFQKYIYKLFTAYPQLSVKMRDFTDYLEQSLKRLDTINENLFKEIKAIQDIPPQELLSILNNSYDTLDTGIPGDNIEILGFPLKKKKIGTRSSIIEENSQFVIDSTKSTDKPLVLQNKFSEPLIYTDANVKWDSNWKVPYFDENRITERTLPPGQLDNYPYLTVSDFLQPYLIRLPYALDSEKYFSGNVTIENGDENKSYLLPLTKKFFEFFDTTDLQKPLTNGKPMFEMKVYAGSVDVSLRIPIKGNSNVKNVTFQRSYSSAKRDNLDVSNNKGQIIDNKVSLAVYPFFKSNTAKCFHRIMLLDQGVDLQNMHNHFELKFYNNNSTKKLDTDKTSRTLKKDGIIQTDFYSLEDSFDYIDVGYSNFRGVVIPNFKTKNGSKTIKFAVDFGTTNTHIEYKIDDDGPYPFEITDEDLVYVTLHKSESGGQDIIEMDGFIRHEFLPNIISSVSEFNFPIRTVTGESENLSYSTIPVSLADINIPFDYEVYASNKNTSIETGLKWSDFQDDRSNNRVRVEKFIEKLLLLIRAKVLSLNGNLNKTELIWFYPSSMEPDKVGKLEDTWNNYLKKYFGSGKIKKFSESIAPFYYYQKYKNVFASDVPVVSVDIGGGTSDIVVFKENTPIVLTSVRYAANSIFGDAYGGSPIINGFIIKYKEQILQLLKDNKLVELENAFNQILNKNKSEDLIAFFFSLENNKTIRSKKVPLSFNKFLSDDNNLKIIFLVFFCSLIYHISKLMKAKGLEAPRDILFSGTGSKVILIASGNSNLDKLNKLTKIIFEKVYDTKIENSIQLNIEPNPKEITCKGGLEIDAEIKNIEDIKAVLIGDITNDLNSKNLITYNNLNEDLYHIVKEEVDEFIDLFFSLNDFINFKNNFGVNPTYMDKYSKILKNETMNFLKTGVSKKKKALGGNTNIALEESLFFYPLVGSLNKLAFEITKFKD